LGFTLSNLDEMQFFEEYTKVCADGDLIIFPMQFIPEEVSLENQSEFNEIASRMRRHYDFEDGRRLAKAGLTNLSDNFRLKELHRPDIKRIHFYNNPTSVCIDFSITLEDEDDDKATSTHITARSSRHKKQVYLSYLNRLGFREVYISPEMDGVCSLMIEYRKPTDSPLARGAQ
jgi:hypothetical protein